jgi:hypothetical protein
VVTFRGCGDNYFYSHARQGSVFDPSRPRTIPERTLAILSHFVVTSGAYDRLIPNPEFTTGCWGEPGCDRWGSSHSFAPHGTPPCDRDEGLCARIRVVPDGSLDNLDHALASSKRWKLFYRNSDTVIYELVATT